MFNDIFNKAGEVDGTVGLVIEDLESGERREMNSGEVFPAASVIKLTILWELFRRIEAGDFSLNTEIELLDNHKIGGFGILKEMHSGIRPTLEDLAVLMVVLSDNVATNILIDLLGMDAINDTAASLGLQHSSLQRKMMDGEAKARGLDNFIAPADVALILKHYLEGPELSADSREKMMDILKRQQCNNKLPLRLPAEAVLAHKTGDLPGTEHDAGVLYLPDRKVIVVVMTRDLASNDEGVEFNNDVGELLYAAYTTK